jgi:uncharacterized membrane protein YkoI
MPTDNGPMNVWTRPRYGCAPLRTLLVTAALLGVLGATNARSRDDDHDRALQAVQAGQVLPLRSVLERLEREHPGQVLGVELENDGERWLYEIKLLQAGGQRIKLELDAKTGEVLRRKSRGDHHRDRKDHGR